MQWQRALRHIWIIGNDRGNENMKAKIIRIDREHIDQEAMREAGEVLKGGGLVAFPTETVYGLGGNAMDPEASKKIYAAKGRPSDNPLIVHIADMESLKVLTPEVPEKAAKLAAACWPGPLTMIFKKTDAVPYETTGGLDSVAVRMPSHPVALELIRAAGGFVAAPSANTSGRPSPTCADHVKEDLADRIDMIVDGGNVGIGLESTIVDFTEEVPTILRPGYLNQERLSEILGEVRMDPGIMSEDSKVRPKAPGMRYRHYAPKAQLIVVEGSTDRVVDKINELASELQEKGSAVGIICTDETIGRYGDFVKKSIGRRTDEEGIARHLYGILRDFDKEEVQYIYSEAFDTPQMGQAIMNRLLKAAGHMCIEV